MFASKYGINFEMYIAGKMSISAGICIRKRRVLLLQISIGVVWQTRDLHLSRNTLYLLSPPLCLFIVLICDLIVNRDDSLTSCEPNNQLIFVALQKLRTRLAPLNRFKHPPTIFYITDRSKSELLIWLFWCQF